MQELSGFGVLDEVPDDTLSFFGGKSTSKEGSKLMFIHGSGQCKQWHKCDIG